MIELVYSPEAINDLLQTKTYIAEELCSETAAQHTIDTIVKRIRLLSEYPETGASLSAVVGFDTDYRYLVCGNYTAFYRFESHRVMIVRVLYYRRDFMRILFEPDAE